MWIDNHIMLPLIGVRALDRRDRWIFAISAGIGGAVPDLISFVEHVLFWIKAIDHQWMWRNWAHDFSTGGIIIPLMVSVLWIPIGASMIPRYGYTILTAGLVFAVGYCAHLGLDALVHAEGGGWEWWAYILDWALRLVWILVVIDEMKAYLASREEAGHE